MAKRSHHSFRHSSIDKVKQAIVLINLVGKDWLREDLLQPSPFPPAAAARRGGDGVVALLLGRSLGRLRDEANIRSA